MTNLDMKHLGSKFTEYGFLKVTPFKGWRLLQGDALYEVAPFMFWCLLQGGTF